MVTNSSVEQLTPLDLLMPRTYIGALLTFRTTDSTPTISKRLQPGLDSFLKSLPWLAGHVFPTGPTEGQPPSLELRWDSSKDSVKIIDKGAIKAPYLTLAANNMPPADVPTEVWPVPLMIDDNLFAAGAPVLGASVFQFGDNQGVGLCICAHHNAVDATGFAEIIKLLTQALSDTGLNAPNPGQARCSRLSQALAPELDAISSWSQDSLFESHPEYSKSFPALPTEFPPCTSKVFSIPVSRIDEIKKRVGVHMENTPTTNTIVSALVWSTITRARMQRNPALSGETSRLALAVNGRRRVGEKLSAAEDPYMGNMVLYALASHAVQPMGASAEENNFGRLAGVCGAISGSHSADLINPQSIAEVHKLAAGLEDYRTLFVGWDLFGSRDLTITSWADLDLYAMDFGAGLGRPDFVRVPYNEADGVGLVLPRKRAANPGAAGNEVVEVMIMLRRDDMATLEENEI